MRKSILLVFVGVLAEIAAPQLCHAEEFGAHTVLEDAKLYFTAPIRWDSTDWLYLGGTLALIGAAHEYDANVRRHFAVGDRAVLNGQDKNAVREAIPAAAVVTGTWVFAKLFGNPAGRVEAYTMLEAAGFSSITTEALKFAAGRARPNETTRVDDWRKGGSSFPSLHVSAAFAIGTVLAESGGDDFRWTRRVLGYGMAAATGYVRVHDNVHWLSDTVAGAAIGIATAHFTLNRREERARRLELSVAPMDGGGTMVRFSMTLQ